MEFNLMNLLTILGTAIGVIGLIYAFIVARRQDRRKLLTYNVRRPLPIATVLPDRTEYTLSILYEREGEEPVNIGGAYISYLQLGNLGKAPIRKEDLALKDPLRIEISNAQVLDIVSSKTSRDVINFELETPETENGETTAKISFDFLDHLDGAIIRILTDSANPSVSINGTVIGMPYGIIDFRDLGGNTVLNWMGCSFAVILQVSAIIGSLLVFRSVTGGWELLWVFLLPIAALLLPGTIVGLVASFLWPKGPSWPSRLAIPDWFISMEPLSRRRYYHLMASQDLDPEILEFYDIKRSTVED